MIMCMECVRDHVAAWEIPGTVHLESNATNIFNELTKTDRLMTGNLDEKDFLRQHGACSVQASLR